MKTLETRIQYPVKARPSDGTRTMCVFVMVLLIAGALILGYCSFTISGWFKLPLIGWAAGCIVGVGLFAQMLSASTVFTDTGIQLRRGQSEVVYHAIETWWETGYTGTFLIVLRSGKRIYFGDIYRATDKKMIDRILRIKIGEPKIPD